MDHSLTRLQHSAVMIFFNALYCTISHAETMAETVPGVRDIHNQLQVTGRQQSSEQMRTVQQKNGRTRV